MAAPKCRLDILPPELTPLIASFCPSAADATAFFQAHLGTDSVQHGSSRRLLRALPSWEHAMAQTRRPVVRPRAAVLQAIDDDEQKQWEGVHFSAGAAMGALFLFCDFSRLMLVSTWFGQNHPQTHAGRIAPISSNRILLLPPYAWLWVGAWMARHIAHHGLRRASEAQGRVDAAAAVAQNFGPILTARACRQRHVDKVLAKGYVAAYGVPAAALFGAFLFVLYNDITYLHALGTDNASIRTTGPALCALAVIGCAHFIRSDTQGVHARKFKRALLASSQTAEVTRDKSFYAYLDNFEDGF